ncbi:hypothetical protein M8009_17455 [Halomonas sp. ATCH28]|uniref:Uncharacterized protein n=1 Tax=Halomonas gemina TaxID=2945105 RepID=A0ABT0T576_9GAMM|nr:hypothetical protein [Halomonas gemina]MCL7942073.1 hypothetical protein [Halomonas gemina]
MSTTSALACLPWLPFSKRRRTLFWLQHHFHMLTGSLSMSMLAERVLLEARGIQDGDTFEIDI